MALDLEIPGIGSFRLTKIVFDLNGTLSEDGKLSSKTLSLLNKVGEILEVHILTADTMGTAHKISRKMNFKIKIITGENTLEAKAKFVEHLGPAEVIAVGNGSNDVGMLEKAAIGIAVLGSEGCSKAAVQSADLFVKTINDALKIILNPQRLVATLRL